MKNILIVEDELLIAEDIKTTLEELGHNVIAIVVRADKAIEILNSQKVDLILLDITIKGGVNGIDLAEIVNQQFKIPFIYLTSHADPKTVTEAIKTAPQGYVVKPYSNSDLYTSIALAFENEKEEAITFLTDIDRGHFFLKIDGMYQKLFHKDILYFRAAGNYIEVHQKYKKYLVRQTFKKLSELIPASVFVQTHKSYILNREKISSFNTKHVYIDQHEFLLGRTFTKSFIDSFTLG
jgi:DNA-binding LytR/AlgR family response regulator